MSSTRQLNFWQRLLQLYSYHLPVRLVGLLQHERFSHSQYLDTFCRLPDLAQYQPVYGSFKSRILVAWAYYVWGIYVVAAVLSFLQSWLAGILVLVFLPLITASAVYVIAYILDLIRNPSIKRLLGYDFTIKKPDATSTPKKRHRR